MDIGFEHFYDCFDLEWGYRCFLTLGELSNGYLQDDGSLLIPARMKITPHRDDNEFDDKEEEVLDYVRVLLVGVKRDAVLPHALRTVSVALTDKHSLLK